MIQINRHILEYFYQKNRLSAGRLFFYVKSKLNNHLHLSDFKQISKDLCISTRVIKKSLKQLQELSICTNYSNNYWRIFSWKKWYYIKKNRIDNINIEELKNLKFLRTFFYRNLYHWSNKVARNNTKKRANSHTSSFVEVSASFVKSVTYTNISSSTLLKHLKRAEDFNLVKVKRSSIIIESSLSIDKLKIIQKHLTFKTTIKPYDGKFLLLKHYPNKISF